jgi:biotin transport system substrate-specific component
MTTRQSLRDFVYPALFSALTIGLGAISIPIPFSPVPVSGTSLGIMLAGSILTRRQAFNSALTILLLGIAGLPVFSGFTGGLGVFLGPRGGYYIGFLPAAWIIASLRGERAGFARLFAANLTGGILVVYVVAVPWLAFVTGLGPYQAFTAGALPFIIGDVAKSALSGMLAIALRKHAAAFRSIK